MTEGPGDDRRLLADRMERERVKRELGDWDDVARRMKLSSALLRRIRNGTAPITYKTEVKIENFYGWPDGEVQRLLKQGAGAQDPTDDQIAEMSARELAAHALHVEKMRGIEARKSWLKHAYSVWWAALGTLENAPPNGK